MKFRKTDPLIVLQDRFETQKSGLRLIPRGWKILRAYICYIIDSNAFDGNDQSISKRKRQTRSTKSRERNGYSLEPQPSSLGKQLYWQKRDHGESGADTYIKRHAGGVLRIRSPVMLSLKLEIHKAFLKMNSWHGDQCQNFIRCYDYLKGNGRTSGSHGIQSVFWRSTKTEAQWHCYPKACSFSFWGKRPAAVLGMWVATMKALFAGRSSMNRK